MRSVVEKQTVLLGNFFLFSFPIVRSRKDRFAIRGERGPTFSFFILGGREHAPSWSVWSGLVWFGLVWVGLGWGGGGGGLGWVHLYLYIRSVPFRSVPSHPIPPSHPSFGRFTVSGLFTISTDWTLLDFTWLA